MDQNFPTIKYDVHQTPFEWGLFHGESFREGIKLLTEIRKDLLLSKNPALKDSLQEQALLQFEETKKLSLPLSQELEGIAQGANLSLTEIVILNNYTDFRDIDLSDQGCSTIHSMGKDFSFSGQTWDMHSSAKDYICTIVVPKTKGHPGAVVFSLVGCTGMMGINTEKVLIGVNNINTIKAQSGVIWPCLVRHVLNESSHMTKACNILKKAKVTSGHNYLLSTPQNGQHWEISPQSRECVGSVSPDMLGHTFHTNHCLGPHTSQLENKDSLSSTTHARYKLLEDLAPKTDSFPKFKSLLTDHTNYPKSICSHYESGAQDPSFTCGGGIFDFNNGIGQFWRGCPVHDRNYSEYNFSLKEGSFHESRPLP